jgi:hypothetical protein
MKGGEPRYSTHKKDLGRLFCSVQTRKFPLALSSFGGAVFGIFILSGYINNLQNFLQIGMVITMSSDRCFGWAIFDKLVSLLW